LKIGEFSKRSGIPITTLRYYDQIGVLQARREGKNRVYSKKDLEKAVVIIFLQDLNFELLEIKELLQLDELMEKNKEGKIPPEVIDRGSELLKEKKVELQEKLEGLKEAIAYLEHILEKINFLREGD